MVLKWSFLMYGSIFNSSDVKCVVTVCVLFKPKVRLDFITAREYVSISAPILIKTFLASNKKSTDAQGFVKLQWFGG